MWFSNFEAPQHVDVLNVLSKLLLLIIISSLSLTFDCFNQFAASHLCAYLTYIRLLKSFVRITGVCRRRADSAEIMGKWLLQWYLIKCEMLSNTLSFVLTTPSGSMSSKCLGWLEFKPVRTYWFDAPGDSRTKKSPSCRRSASAWQRSNFPWNQSSNINWELWTSGEREKACLGMSKTSLDGGIMAGALVILLLL